MLLESERASLGLALSKILSFPTVEFQRMKKIQLLVEEPDRDRAGDAGRPLRPRDERNGHGRGVVKIEAVVSDAQAEDLINLLVRKVSTETINARASELVSQELKDAGPDANNLYYDFVSRIEQELIRQVIEDSRGVQTVAAARLGINRNTLRKKMLEYGLEHSLACDSGSVDA